MSRKIEEQAPPAELVIVLDPPIMLGELSYSTITLREPTAGQWAQWDRLSGIDADIAAIAVVSGVPEPAIRKLPARKLLEGSRYIARFLA